MIAQFAENNKSKLRNRSEKRDILAWVYFLHEEMHEDIHKWVVDKSQWVKAPHQIVKLRPVYVEMESPKSFSIELAGRCIAKKYADQYDEDAFNEFLNISVQTSKAKKASEELRKRCATMTTLETAWLDDGPFAFRDDDQTDFQIPFYKRFETLPENPELGFYKTGHRLPDGKGGSTYMGHTPENSENESGSDEDEDKVEEKRIKQKKSKKPFRNPKFKSPPASQKDFRNKSNAEIVAKAKKDSEFIDDDSDQTSDEDDADETIDDENCDATSESDDDDDKDESLKSSDEDSKKNTVQKRKSRRRKHESESEEEDDKKTKKSDRASARKQKCVKGSTHKRPKIQVSTVQTTGDKSQAKSTSRNAKRQSIKPRRFRDQI
jgi:hypothetical protein